MEKIVQGFVPNKLQNHGGENRAIPNQSHKYAECDTHIAFTARDKKVK
jgi:hypothetical protein